MDQNILLTLLGQMSIMESTLIFPLTVKFYYLAFSTGDPIISYGNQEAHFNGSLSMLIPALQRIVTTMFLKKVCSVFTNDFPQWPSEENVLYSLSGKILKGTNEWLMCYKYMPTFISP